MQMSSLILFVKSKYYPSICTVINASSLYGSQTENSDQLLKAYSLYVFIYP